MNINPKKLVLWLKDVIILYPYFKQIKIIDLDFTAYLNYALEYEEYSKIHDIYLISNNINIIIVKCATKFNP